MRNKNVFTATEMKKINKLRWKLLKDINNLWDDFNLKIEEIRNLKNKMK